MADDFTHKLVIVVRRDLKLSPGKMAAQVAHAAVDCSLKSKADQERTFKKWKSEGQKKVVVRVDSERDLHELKLAAEDRGLVTSIISDAGLTEVPPGTVTVLGIGPAANAEVDQVTGKLPLL
ncbi:MAG: peptidyl-tRNA hydrolase [Euryarchaeota archaeon]|nr:peptidyl-tRNA hydrolase [Euryarchaeota archaeon]